MNIWDFEVGDEIVYCDSDAIICNAVVLGAINNNLYVLVIDLDDPDWTDLKFIRFPLKDDSYINKTGVRYCLSSSFIREILNKSAS